MTLIETIAGKSFKALEALRSLKDVSDNEVIELYSRLSFQVESKVTWAHVMSNIHGVPVEQLLQAPEDDLFSSFYKFINNTVTRELNFLDVQFSELSTYFPGAGRSIMGLALLLSKSLIRSDQAKDLLRETLKPENSMIDLETILNRFNLDEDSSGIDEVIKKIIADNPKVIAEYKSGKDKALNSLMGQVMKQVKGNPQEILSKLKALA